MDNKIANEAEEWEKARARSKQPRLTVLDVSAVLDKVKFKDRVFLLHTKGNGFLLQMEYLEPDVEHPEKGPVRQATRKYYLSPYMTESEIVETCWLMVKRSQEHVASEHFTYEGRRVYSQHFDVRARVHMCDEERYDKRVDP